METCHVSPLPVLSAHPAERGEECPWQRDGAGGWEHALPGRSDPALRSLTPCPLCRQRLRGWGLELGAPSVLQSKNI